MINGLDDKYTHFYKFNLPGSPDADTWDAAIQGAAIILNSIMMKTAKLEEKEDFAFMQLICEEEGHSGVILATNTDVHQIIKDNFSAIQNCSHVTDFFAITEQNAGIAMIGPKAAADFKHQEQIKAVRGTLPRRPKPKLR